MSEIGEIPVNPGQVVNSSEGNVGSRIGLGAAEIAVNVAGLIAETLAQDVISEQKKQEQQRIEQAKLNAVRAQFSALLDQAVAPRHGQPAREAPTAQTLASDRAELALSQDAFVPGSTGYSSTELANMRANRQPFTVNAEAWQQHAASYKKFNGQEPPSVDTSRGRYLYQQYVVNAYNPWQEEAAKAGYLMQEREHRITKDERAIDHQYAHRETWQALDTQRTQPAGITPSPTETPTTHEATPIHEAPTSEPVAAPTPSSSGAE